ncbi:DUF4145 domain-containing protein [Geothrix paludis]|uniref:DUF4145 domain-containing protein n=1 Tax=Geothrix paludis TaxID=2922722 RepID=UPI001FAC23E1|nr:DUF4145 domain-containing protein [Geothrix paludis]
MHQVPYTPPTYLLDGFNCPFCHAFSTQHWGKPYLVAGQNQYGPSDLYWMCRCNRCGKWSFWVEGELKFPQANLAPTPNVDLPEEIAADFEEARAILQNSPRGASALLRLCIQKLCVHLKQPGKNINDDIATLVQLGLPIKIQQALDIVRVVGNNAVHPGQLDLKDDVTTATQLFGLVNIITDALISQPKQIEAMYSSVIPEGQRNAIEKRDKA